MRRVGRAIISTRGRCEARHSRSANSLTIQKQYIGTRTMNVQRRYSQERVGVWEFEGIRIRRLVCNRTFVSICSVHSQLGRLQGILAADGRNEGLEDVDVVV